MATLPYSCLEKSHGEEEPGGLKSMGSQESDTAEQVNKTERRNKNVDHMEFVFPS